MLHSLRKIIQAVSAAEDLQSALKLVVHQVRRAMRTDVCSIYLYFPQTDKELRHHRPSLGNLPLPL
jgi:phosphotransferase system enzyme I (PtsP)